MGTEGKFSCPPVEEIVITSDRGGMCFTIIQREKSQKECVITEKARLSRRGRLKGTLEGGGSGKERRVTVQWP